MKAMQDFTEGDTWVDEQIPHEHWQEPVRWTGKTEKMRDGLDGRHRTTEIGLLDQPQLNDGQGSRERLRYEHRGMIDGDLECMRDLEFKKGDLIQVTNAKGRWFEGYRKDDPEERIGRFPSTYVTEYHDKLTRFISVTIFSASETRTEFEQNALRAAKVVSKAGSKGAKLAETSLTSPSVLDPHIADETGLTASVKIGKPNKWGREESTQNPVEYVDDTAEFGNTVSGVYGSSTDPIRVDRRGETITFKEKLGVTTLHHAKEDKMAPDKFSAAIMWDESKMHHLDENFGLVLSRCGHVMGYIDQEHGGPSSMAGIAKYSRVLAVDGRPVAHSKELSAKDAILDILDDINTRGALTSVSFKFQSDSLPVGWEVREADVNGNVHYKYMDVLSGRMEDEWPTPEKLKKMRNLNEYKKTGLYYSVPKFIHLDLTRESRQAAGTGTALVDVKVGELQIPIKADLQELENLRLLYTRLKEEQLEENTKKGQKAKKGLQKYESDHHELERDTYEHDKNDLVELLFRHITRKDLYRKRPVGTMPQLQEQRLWDELECMSMHELRERAITHGMPVEMGRSLLDPHVDRRGVDEMLKYKKKVEKQDDQVQLLKNKIEALELKLATPTWYRLERSHDKHGGYAFNKGKWEEKDPHTRGPRENTMPLWSPAEVFEWVAEEVVKKPEFGISPSQGQAIAKALKVDGVNGRRLAKLDRHGVQKLLPTALQDHAESIVKAVEAEAKDPKEWNHDTTLSRMNDHASQFEHDPPAWVKLSIAVTVEAPEDEKALQKKHHEVPRADVHHYQMGQADAKETKRSMFMRACCGKPQATDKRGRPATRREHAATVAATRNRRARDIVMVVKEGELVGFKLDDDMFVTKIEGDSVAKKHDIRHGMYLYAFKPASKALMVIDELLNSKSLSYKWEDVQKLVGKYKDDVPHEYHFRVDKVGDKAMTKLKRRGVYVKGYGYAPVGHEPVDVINAIRDRLDSLTKASSSKVRKAKYTAFFKEAHDITMKMLDTSAGLPPGAKLTDPLMYAGDSKGNIEAMFNELEHPYGKSAAKVLDERNPEPEMLAQLLIYWLDRQIHNAAEPGHELADVQPGIIGLSRFEPWSQTVEFKHIIGTITPAEFERAIEAVTDAVGCTTKCEVTAWQQRVKITGVPADATELESDEGMKQLCEGLAVAHGLGQRHHRGSVHHKEGWKEPTDQVRYAASVPQDQKARCVKVTPNRALPARGHGCASDISYIIDADMSHVKRGPNISLSSIALANALNDAGGKLPVFGDDDFLDIVEGVPVSRVQSETTLVEFTLTGSERGGAVSLMHKALGWNLAAQDRDACKTRLLGYLNRAVTQARTVHNKLSLIPDLHAGGAAAPDQIVDIGEVKMAGDPQVQDEVTPYVDAFDNQKDEHHRFRNFVQELREPSRTTLRGLAYLLQQAGKRALDQEESEFNGTRPLQARKPFSSSCLATRCVAVANGVTMNLPSQVIRTRFDRGQIVRSLHIFRNLLLRLLLQVRFSYCVSAIVL
jgi:hypothetical protein